MYCEFEPCFGTLSETAPNPTFNYNYDPSDSVPKMINNPIIVT